MAIQHMLLAVLECMSADLEAPPATQTVPTTRPAVTAVGSVGGGGGAWGRFELHRRLLGLVGAVYAQPGDGPVLLSALCCAPWLFQQPGLAQRLMGVAEMAASREGG